MLTIEWVEEEIRKALKGSNTPQNVRDYALLCIARDNLRAATSIVNDTPKDATVGSQERNIEPVYDSPLFSRELSVEEIESLMCRMRVGCRKDKEKARDLQTWLNIAKESQMKEDGD